MPLRSGASSTVGFASPELNAGCSILEVAIVAGTAMLVLRGRPTPSMRGLPVRPGLAGLVIALAVLTTWSVAAGATSGGEHGIHHGGERTSVAEIPVQIEGGTAHGASGR